MAGEWPGCAYIWIWTLKKKLHLPILRLKTDSLTALSPSFLLPSCQYKSSGHAMTRVRGGRAGGVPWAAPVQGPGCAPAPGPSTQCCCKNSSRSHCCTLSLSVRSCHTACFRMGNLEAVRGMRNSQVFPAEDGCCRWAAWETAVTGTTPSKICGFWLYCHKLHPFAVVYWS